MSVPVRAARRGGRVVSESPTAAPTQEALGMSPLSLPGPAAPTASPSVAQMEPSASESSLAPMGSLSSFLESFGGSAPAPGAPTPTTVGVGTVRVRGPATPHKATPATLVSADELKVKTDAAVSKLRAALASAASTADSVFERNASTVALPAFDHPVTLMPEEYRVVAPVSVLARDTASRVLLVEATHHSAIVAFEDAAKQSSVAPCLWDGAVHRGELSSKFVITHVHSFLLLLSAKTEGTGSPLGDFTHVFYVCGTSATEDNRVGLRDTGINTFLQQLFANRAGYTTKLVFVGGVDVDQLKSAIAPREVHVLRSEDFGAERDESVVSDDRQFGPEDAAALVGSSTVHDLTPVPNQGVLGRVTEGVTDAASQLLSVLVANCPANHKLVGVIFCHDANEVAGKLQSSSAILISTDIAQFTHDVKSASPVDKPRFLLLSSAPSRYTARTLLHYVSVIIDFGAERRQGPTPKHEYPFLCRQTFATSPIEDNARATFTKRGRSTLRFLLSRRPGAAALSSAASSPVATYNPSSAVVSSSQLSVMDAILQIARLSIPSQPLFTPISHIESVKRAEYIELSLARLAELCAISAAVAQPGITFVGDLLGRIPLSIENSVLVMHGVVTGLHDAMTLIASILQCPVRTPFTDPADAEAFSAKLRATSSPTARLSDAIVDAFSVLHALSLTDTAQRDAYLQEQRISKRAFDEVVVTYQRVLRQITDYLVDRTSGHGHSLALTKPDAVRLDIEKHASFIVFVIGASHTTKATIVRVERDDRLASKERGNLMFLRTSKEASSSSFVPSVIDWKLGTVVVPGQINNTNTKFYLSSQTSLAHKYLWVALILMNPTLDFDRVGPSNVVFAVTVNRQTRRFSTDVATSVRLLDAREAYNKLLGCVLLRRCTTLTLTSYLSMLEGHGVQLEKLRRNVVESFVSLTQECDVSEVSLSAPITSLARSLHLAPLILDEGALSNVAVASDVAITNAVRHGTAAPANGTNQAAAAGAASPSAAVSASPAPAKQEATPEEESLVWAGGVIEEDGDEVILESQLRGVGGAAAPAIIEDD